MKILTSFLIIIFLLLFAPPTFGLTLHEFEQAAKNLNEFPSMDNTDPIDPDYSSYLKSITPNKWIGFLSPIIPLVTKESLSDAINTVLQKSTYVQKDHFAFPVAAGDRIVCWGDLHGAFHSLLRCLMHLKAEGIIDDSLKITQPNIKFIFMGNVIDRSAYSLESLMLVLTLIAQNPQQVIYLRGSHENKQNWQNYDFKRELYTRLRITNLQDPTVRLLNTFFDALPSIIFLQEPGETESFIAFNSLYRTATESLIAIKPKIEALITNQSRSRIYQSTQGVNLLPPERGIPTWTLFSSPTRSFQQLYDFYNDSFAILEVGSKERSSSITAYTHNLRQPASEFSKQTFHLISGQSLKQGEHPAVEWLDVAIACPLDLSESAKILGERLRAGIDLRIRKLNREGGIHHKLLKVYFENDKHLPYETLNNVKKLSSTTKANIILTPLGSGPTMAVIPWAQEHGFLVSFPYAGDVSLRKPELTNIIHFRTSTLTEVRALIKYAREKLLKEYFAIFYMNDASGEDLLKEAKRILEQEYNLPSEKILAVSYPRETIDINKAAEAIQMFSPDALILLSSFDAAKALVDSVDAAFWKNVTLLAFSFVTDRFKDFASGALGSQTQGKGLDVLISRVMPDPKQDRSTIVQEYRQEIDKVYPGARYDVDSLEGYINTSILIDALQNVSPPITLEKVIDELQAMKNYDLQGLQLNFDPSTRELSKQVWIDKD